MLQLSKVKNWGKSFFSFLFSYQGTINRTQYFVGFILINLFVYMFRHGVHTVLFFLIEFVYLYILFALVQKRCRDIGKDALWMTIGLSISIVLIMISRHFSLEKNVIIHPFVIGVTILAILIHLYLMVTMGDEEAKQKVINSTFLLSQPFVLPILLELLMIFGFVAGQAWIVKHRFLFEAPAAIYANQYGYTKVCHQHGYELVGYPQKFVDFYEENIQIIEKKLKAYGFPVSSILNENSYDNLDYAVEKDLNELKRNLILGKLAEKKHVSKDTLEWQDEYDDQMSMYDVCKYIDDNADDLIQANDSVSEILEKAIQ